MAVSAGSSSEKQVVFVGGTARSGTSTCTELIRSHAAIAMGRERYPTLIRCPARPLDRSIFDKDRFCLDLQSDDTHHRTLGPYYEKLYERFDRCTHVGDKVPNLNVHYPRVFSAFPDAKILFMLRNIFDVAASFEARAEQTRANPTQSLWPASRGVCAAVDEWNLAIEQTLPLLTSGQIMAVEYERLYVDETLLPEIFSFLSLDMTPTVRRAWEAASRKRSELDGARVLKLSSEQKLFIMKTARFDLYERFIEAADLSQASAAQPADIH